MSLSKRMKEMVKIYYSSYNRNDLYIKTYSASIGWVEWEK